MSRADGHELPLADRLAADAVREWLDQHTATALAAAPSNDAAAAIESMRHLHLDGYRDDLVPAVLGALGRAGLLATKEADDAE